MAADEATRYLAIVVRCNFWGCDRAGVEFAAKEAPNWMALPCECDSETIARIGNHLNGGARRMAQVFPAGADDGAVRAYSGSGRVGCVRTRKSTSGGVLRIGGCMFKHWSSTQKAVARSSAEAELYAAIGAFRGANGLRSLCKDFGEHFLGLTTREGGLQAQIRRRR